MRYQITIRLDDHVEHLLDALSEHLPVEFYANALAAIDSEALASGEPIRLSAAGHVAVQVLAETADPTGPTAPESGPESDAGADEAPAEPSAETLVRFQVDANRRNIKTARTICDSWASAFGPNSAFDGQQAETRLGIFRRGLAELG